MGKEEHSREGRAAGEEARGQGRQRPGLPRVSPREPGYCSCRGEVERGEAEGHQWGHREGNTLNQGTGGREEGENREVGLYTGRDRLRWSAGNWKTNVPSVSIFKKKISPLPPPLLNLAPFFVLFINTLL